MWDFLKRIPARRRGTETAELGASRKRIKLSATPLGAKLAANGGAELRDDGDWRHFLVEISAEVPDGTVLILKVNEHPVGPVLLRNGEGDWEAASSDGELLPKHIAAGSEISAVSLEMPDGRLVLSGSF